MIIFNQSLIYKSLIIFVLLTSSIHAQELKNVIIMGYGGRAQWLLMKCLEQKKDISIVAICDNHAEECIDHVLNLCDELYAPLKKDYQKSISNVDLFPDTSIGIEHLFEKHKNVDLIWITSRNDRHFDHLSLSLQKSNCKKIFMEKPLFRTLEEFKEFDWSIVKNRNILIGLTLRYSSMALIVSQQLKNYQKRLGKLIEIKAWERLGFFHALGSFVLGTRRFKSLWGGLLLEKSIHDIDLSLYFISSLGLYPSKIVLNSIADNRFFTRTRQFEIMDLCAENFSLIDKVKEVLSSYPEDDHFISSDIIPDYHKMSAILSSEGSDPILFEVETDMSSYRKDMERGTLLTFENGSVCVDIMKSCMTICIDDGRKIKYDLNTLYGGHADGDKYIVHAILNENLLDNHLSAKIDDSIVILSNILALTSEKQVKESNGLYEIYMENKSWWLRDSKNQLFKLMNSQPN